MKTTARLILAAALLVPVPALAQRVTSVAEMVEELNAGVPAAQVLKHLRLDCATFRLDADGEAKLQLAGVGSDFMKGVRDHCLKGIAKVEVTSSIPGAIVRIDGRQVGTTPLAPTTVPVGGPATVDVVLGNQTRSAQTFFEGGQLTRVAFTMARDTSNWSNPRSAMAIAQDLGVLNEFRATEGRPTEPRRRGSGGFGRSFLFMLLGAGGGYAYGMLAPNSGCINKQTLSRDSYVNDEFIPAGTEVDIGGGTTCMGIAAGIGAGGGLLFSLPINAAVGGGRRRGFEKEMAEYPAKVAAWEQTARESFVNNHPRVQQVLEQERATAARIQESNRQIASGNAAPVAPQISVEALSASEIEANRPRVVAQVPIKTEKDVAESDVDINIPKGVGANPNAIAVVIGNRNYESTDVPAVDYALRDAQTMKKYLIETFGFSEDNIIYAEDAKVSKFFEIFGSPTDERGKLHNFVTTAKEKPDVFVFYSGHGAPDLNTGKGYLVPSDANPNFIGQNGYPIEALYKNLAKLPIRSLTIAIDACFSGGSEKGALIKAASPLYISVDNVLLTAPGAVGFTASAAREVSSWFEEKRHGLFTYYFLKGLQGSADADSNKVITGRELGEFVKDNVLRNARRTKNREQNPQLIGRDLDRVLVRLQGAGGQ